MAPVVTVTILSALFVGSHLLFAATPIRSRLVDWLGEIWFVVVYSLVSWVTFGAAVLCYSSHRLDGLAGLGLAHLTWVRLVASVIITIGVCLIIGIMSPSGYVASPMAIFSGENAEPRGMARVTRHSMFVSAVLFGLGHCLVAVKATGIVFFGSLALLGVVGSWHQDAKLRARRGEGYEAYLRQTSTVPFLAILAGGQKLVLRELPWLFLGLGGVAAWGAYSLHGADFAYTAHAIIVLFVVSPLVLMLWCVVRGRRERG